MDRITSRKIHLSEESSQAFEKANKFFDEVQNEITFLLAQEYLEKGKIEPNISVVEFLKKKDAKGFNAETEQAMDTIVPIENVDNFIFPCHFTIDGTAVAVNFFVDKIKEGTPTSGGVSMPPKNESVESNEEDNTLAARRRR